jgi:FKBP-type peptidyl-prolyl cis-trans isomerase (trigger factor)
MTYTIKEFKELKETSEVKVTISIDSKSFAKYADKALKHFSKIVKVSGFRAGKVPKEVIIKNIGTAAIAEEAANLAIKNTYPDALKEKKILIIDAPVITVNQMPDNTKIDEDFEYSLTAPVPPVFKLADYKKVSKSIFAKQITVKVTDKEIAATTLDLRKRRKQIELVEKGIAPEKAQTEAEKVAEKDLPELDDKFLETLGGFKNLDEFKVQLKETIKKEKESKELNKRRAQWVDTMVEKTKISLPTVLISHELDRLQAQFEGDLQQVGSNLNAYLKSIGKDSEKFLEELKPQAEKQAKLQLILNQIAEEEKLIPEAKAVELELKHIMEHHKDVNMDSARAYVTMQMRNQMVFSFLELQK